VSLPYDIARCTGTTHELCQYCRRREPGREGWQVFIGPAIDMMNQHCDNRIPPAAASRLTDDSAPFEAAKRVASNGPNQPSRAGNSVVGRQGL
jgi:hypothetical protein